MKYLLVLALFLPAIIVAQPADYWQQHVSYKIEGTLIDSIHSFDGKLSVVYTNNSPDTLHEVYFHLYANAFKPGSMMYERAKEMNDQGLINKFEHYKESDWGWYKIKTIDADGSNTPFEITGTIMKVRLSKPLVPRSSVTLSFDFFEQIPLQTRRSGWMNYDGIKYSMSQWYPKICEYDREGWHHQEYVSREFYGVWGEFDVTMTVPAKFCVGSTGQCQNPNEVGWGYDQIANGVKKGKVYPDSVHKTGMIKWNFKASNVHDFAWVAHEYIHEWDTWMDTVTVHCLYKRDEDKSWAEAMKNTFAMLDHHSHKVGWYQYRNFTNTHAGDGGMEYPQLIMDGSPNAGLIMHEGGHQWFYGMIGNNETRYAFLDEGFTEFIEMTGMDWYYGRHNERSPYRDTSWLSKLFIPEYDSRRNYYSPYLSLASSGYEEPLTIPHDWFRENVNAGQVYFKTLAGLAQLEYVMGDSMFWVGMKEYFRRWHFKHPNLNDFKRTMEDVSNSDLDWYFDQWFGATRTIDYRAGSVSSGDPITGGYPTTITACNNDIGVMPLDLTLHYTDGTTGLATIPLAVNQGTAYQKPEAGRIFFPPWDWVSREYKGMAITPKEVSWYEIDTSGRLMDIHPENNNVPHFEWFPGEWTLWKQVDQNPPLHDPYFILRPVIGYDQYAKWGAGFGIKAGVGRRAWFDELVYFKMPPSQTSTTSNTKASSDQIVDVMFKEQFDVNILGRLTKLTLLAKDIDDIGGVNIALEHVIRPTYLSLGATHTIGFDFDYEQRSPFDKDTSIYPIYPEYWTGGFEKSIGFHYHYRSQDRNTQFYFATRAGQVKEILWSGDNTIPIAPPQSGTEIQAGTVTATTITDGFTQFEVGFSQKIEFSRNFDLSIRATLASNGGILPTQYEYNLSGATYSQSLRTDFFRTISSIDRNFSSRNNLLVEGGAGVRGYGSARFDPQNRYALQGNDLLGLNLEIGVPSPLAWAGAFARTFQFGLFADAGWVGNYKQGNAAAAAQSLSDVAKGVMTDAGISVRVNILSWLPWQLQGVAEQYGSIPNLAFYFPFYLNHPLDGKGNFAYRSVVSLGTSFKL
ncbi:MAG TPA: M1 family aminopeptidase [Candidatus Kapabacteria bacterium]|nr:M1 family aminopeptidase [Candidatus Kapabacteria bacterium]